jgi:hypothetical protein
MVLETLECVPLVASPDHFSRASRPHVPLSTNRITPIHTHSTAEAEIEIKNLAIGAIGSPYYFRKRSRSSAAKCFSSCFHLKFTLYILKRLLLSWFPS